MTKIAIHTELNTSFALTGGERVWKLTGAIERMSINGKDFFDQSILNDKTLYTSPYMVVTDREYTKHYYIESQRVTSKLGGGMANNLVDPNGGTLDCIAGDATQLSTDLMANLQQITCVEGMGIEVEPQLQFIEESVQQDNVESEQYFYHGDHLGSSSWITDGSGNVNQHLAYMPFGESFIDQRASGHDIRFKFTGKERDSKTGFDYFGARYYASDLSVWLSVDPLSDLLPSTSSYMYCNGNPIMFVDPDGKILRPHPNSSQEFKDKYYADLQKIYNTDQGKKIIDMLNALPVTIYISDCVYWQSNYSDKNRITMQYSASSWFAYDYDGVEYVPFVALGHELKHAFDDYSNSDFSTWGRNKREESAISFENYLRSVYQFDLGLDFALRYEYDGDVIMDESDSEIDFNPELERISNHKYDEHILIPYNNSHTGSIFIPAGTVNSAKTYENKNSSKHGTVLYL